MIACPYGKLEYYLEQEQKLLALLAREQDLRARVVQQLQQFS
jgi:hypothetical protein